MNAARQQRTQGDTLIAIWERNTDGNPIVRQYIAAALRDDTATMQRLIDEVHKQGEALRTIRNARAYAASCAAACVVLVHRREHEVAAVAFESARTHDLIARSLQQ